MGEHNFTEDDKKKLVEFLNLVAKHAKFSMKTDELINYFRALAYVQNSLLPKIDAHILEVRRVVEAKPAEQEQPEAETKKRK